MKLLLCIKCSDIFSLTMEERTCKCGKSSGKYVDQLNAEIKGDCLPLGFANQSFLDALRRQHIENKHYDGNKDTCCKGQEFTAFDLANVVKCKGSEAVLKAMSDHNISQETYETLGKLHDEICDPVNKGNWPIRININYV